jgi:TatA/E family protein of Tat protein translocase
MFGLGTTELIVIAALAMLVFGPKRLPELGRTLGKGMREFKGSVKEIDDLKRSVTDVKDSFKVDLDVMPKDAPKKGAQAKDGPKSA